MYIRKVCFHYIGNMMFRIAIFATAESGKVTSIKNKEVKKMSGIGEQGPPERRLDQGNDQGAELPAHLARLSQGDGSHSTDPQPPATTGDSIQQGSTDGTPDSTSRGSALKKIVVGITAAGLLGGGFTAGDIVGIKGGEAWERQNQQAIEQTVAERPQSVDIIGQANNLSVRVTCAPGTETNAGKTVSGEQLTITPIGKTTTEQAFGI